MKKELDFDLDFNQSIKQVPKNTTSEVLKKHVKIFLEHNDLRQAYFKKNTIKILTDILKNFKLPKPNEQIRIRTQQQINLISIILKIVEVHEVIDNITIATYTLNREALDVLTGLFKSGKIKQMSFLIASSYSFRDKKYYEEIKNRLKGLGSKKVKLTFAWIHLKITLVKCGEDYYQFEGSMNYSTNNMAEQLLLENNKYAYDHDSNFINNILAQYENKALEHVC